MTAAERETGDEPEIIDDPRWSFTTSLAANLAKHPPHRHGPKGVDFYPFGLVVRITREIEKRRGDGRG